MVQSLKRALEKSYRNIIPHHYFFGTKLHLQITTGKQSHLCSRRRELLADTDDKILATVSMTLPLKILLCPPQSLKKSYLCFFPWLLSDWTLTLYVLIRSWCKLILCSMCILQGKISPLLQKWSSQKWYFLFTFRNGIKCIVKRHNATEPLRIQNIFLHRAYLLVCLRLSGAALDTTWMLCRGP